MVFLKLIGILGGAFFLIVTYAFLRKSRVVNGKEDCLSQLACDRKFGLWFNLTLFIYSFTALLFMAQLTDVLGMDYWVIIPFLITVVCGFLTSIFTTKRVPRFHELLGGFGIASGCLGGLIYGPYIYRFSHFLAFSDLVLAVLASVVLVRSLVRNKGVMARHEYTFFCLCLHLDLSPYPNSFLKIIYSAFRNTVRVAHSF